MNRKYLILIVILMAVLIGFQANAVPVTADEAISRALSSGVMRKSAGGSNPRLLRTVKSSGQRNALYIFSLNEAGNFIVVPADDVITPILGYSDSEEIYNPDLKDGELPLPFENWLNNMASEIEYALDNNCPTGISLPENIRPIDPILKTLWGQTGAYNKLTPIIKEKQSPSGCVATALSQILYHYKWPAAPVGSISYTASDFDYSMTFDGITFDWEKMTDIYDDDSSEESIDAVATLMKAVGYSCQMNYGSSSSGATDSNALAGMIAHMGYSADASLVRRESFLRDEWDSMLVKILSDGYPIYYTGRDGPWLGSGGHAFVCDGYDGNGYFHFNWGWDGKYNGYFLTSCMVPSGAGTGGYINGYNYTQSVLINFHPNDNQIYDTIDYLTFEKFTYKNRQISFNPIRKPSNGSYEIGCFIFNNDVIGEPSFTIQLDSDISQIYNLDDLIPINLDPELSYTLVFKWRPLGEVDWKKVVPAASGLIVYSADPTGGRLSFDGNFWEFSAEALEIDPLNAIATDVVFNDSDYVLIGFTNKLSITFENLADDYFNKGAQHFWVDPASGKEYHAFNITCDLDPLETKTYNYSFEHKDNIPAGDYYLRITEPGSKQNFYYDRNKLYHLHNGTSLPHTSDGIFNYMKLPTNEVVIISIAGDELLGGDIVIPAEITLDGEVCQIQKIIPDLKKIFDSKTLTSIDIQCPIKEIPRSSFYQFSALNSIKLPETVTTICDYAFAYTPVTEVRLPERMDSLGRSVFFDCVELERIKIPVVKKINESTFSLCKKLSEIEIPEGVEEIGKTAFNSVPLNNLILPSTIERINSKGFYNITFGQPAIETIECYSAIPPQIESDSFSSSAYRSTTLKVIPGTKELYQADTNGWGKFQNIEELAVTAIDEIENSAEFSLSDGKWYALDGTQLRSIPETSGIYICITPSGESIRIMIP